MASLDALTGITGFDVITNHPIHSRPVEETMEGFIGSFDALMARNRSVVMIVKDLRSYRTTGDAQASIIIHKQAIQTERVMLQQGGQDNVLDRFALEVLDDDFFLLILFILVRYSLFVFIMII